MGKKLYPADTLQQAQFIVTAWDQIEPSLQVGPITSELILAEMDRVQELKERILRLEQELMELRNQRDDACVGIWDGVKKVRAYIRGVYGDDSIQYKLAGGTPVSEKKRYRRKRTAESPGEP